MKQPVEAAKSTPAVAQMTERNDLPMGVDAAGVVGNRPAKSAGLGFSTGYPRPGLRSPGLAASFLPSEYAELKRLVKERRLLDKQAAYYLWNSLITVSLLALGVAVLVLADSLWLRLLDAAFLAIVFTQISFIGHDAGHRQIFRSGGRSDFILLGVSFLIGLERTWWIEKHDRHHRDPNCLDLDPDTNVSMLGVPTDSLVRSDG
jgi:hypothetical protein